MQIMLIGYARVFTTDQNTDLQKKALIRVEYGLIFEDTASGKNAQQAGLKGRPYGEHRRRIRENHL